MAAHKKVKKSHMPSPQHPQPDSFSSCFSQPGQISEIWQTLMHNINRQGNPRIKKHYKEAQRLLRENGAIHNVFAAPGSKRQWTFDPIPMIFDPEQWQKLEAGLIQRAKLFNLLLADIYGPMTLIKKGLLPPELIFSHKGFLYPCVNLQPNIEQPLTVYSANLAQGTQGEFWVMSDQMQPPLGSGYALETRVIMTRSFPQLFENFQVHRLAMYFKALRNALNQLARHNRQDPHIVFLTPGPEDPSYFEHAYFASYLGYPLVQGGDLIVQDSCVWLKSVEGLSQVDVILRRQDGDLCDPLELRGDSVIGIPGLLDAVRCGNVVLANPIGSGILENPALMAFLPGLCQYFLNEKLLLPSIATWWCGQKAEREFVLKNLDRLIIKPIHPIAGLPPMIPTTDNASQRQRWHDLIKQSPHLFIGQEQVQFGTFPTFESDHIEPRHAALTLYLTAQDNSYLVMPGGLSRTHQDSQQLLIPEQSGGQIKDTWVLTHEPDKQVSLWSHKQPYESIQPLLMPLPSRAAENLYWAARYAERAEQTARILRSILIKMRVVNESHDIDERMGLNHLLRALTHITQTYPGFTGNDARQKLDDPRKELVSVILDEQRVGSLRSSLVSLGRAAFTVRDLLPEDAWRAIDAMRSNWKPRISRSQIGSSRLLDSINNLIMQLSAFSGLTYENMSREPTWNMLNIGRRLERAIHLSTLIKATLVPCYGTTMEAQMLEIVLSTCNSLILYRQRYRSFMNLGPALELLLLDDNYPRALACQLRQLHKHISSLPTESGNRSADKDMLLIKQSLDNLSQTDHKYLISLNSSDGRYPLLERMLSEQIENLEKLSGALTDHFFAPTLPPQQFVTIGREMAL